MKSIFHNLIIWVITIVAFSSCRTNDYGIPITKEGTLTVKINYAWGAEQLPFSINQKLVHPKTGDTMTFTMLKYYVSNFKLKRADGIWWSHPESYFLVNAQTTVSSTLEINGVPPAEYVAVQYTMGVDSLRNVSGSQTGALSLQNGMFWDWNSGYIMLKAEGNSPQSPTGAFALHLGGFTGSNNIVTIKNAEFGRKVPIGGLYNPTMTIVANPARLWHSSPGLDSLSVIHMPGSAAHTMAKDFYNNITFTGIQ